MAVNNQDYAIVIGIDNYPQLPMLGAAATDAAKFAEWLLDPNGGGLAPEHVKQIISPTKQDTDPRNALPVQKQIDDQLTEWGAELNKRIGRRLYFYFSGHGIGPDFDDVALLMANANRNRLRSNIGLRPYLRFFADTGIFDEVVFIADCCRDPTLSDLAMPPVFTPEPQDPRPQVVDIALLAAPYGKKAFEEGGPPLQDRRGILTKALLEALRDRPSVDAQGRVTTSTLHAYVTARVKELAAAQGKEQEPIFRGVMNNSLVFGPAAPSALKVHVKTPAGFRGVVRLLHGAGLAEVGSHVFTADDEVWEVPVPRDSLYVIERADNGSARVLDPRVIKDEPHVFQL